MLSKHFIQKWFKLSTIINIEKVYLFSSKVNLVVKFVKSFQIGTSRRKNSQQNKFCEVPKRTQRPLFPIQKESSYFYPLIQKTSICKISGTFQKLPIKTKLKG